MSEGRTNFNPAGMILSTITSHPTLVLLYLLVTISAIAVILSTHHNRQLLIEHEKLMQSKDKLDIEWRHLVLEQGALTEHNRIEATVTKQLEMHRPGTQDEVVVRIK